MASHLDDVSRYAALHVYIFPCWWITDEKRCACGDALCKSPGKHPIRELVPNGHKNATNDPAIIAHWWTVYPLANPALSLAASNLVVIDIDPRNGGDHSFELLEQKHGRITSDVEQITGGGGRHIVFAAKDGERFPGKLGAGIDVKHDGYIMVWPSNHVQGVYEWEGESDLIDGAIPSMRPDWLAMPTTKEYDTNIRPEAPGMGLSALLPEERDELRSALSAIPNVERDSWLRVGMALHSMDSGRDGYAEWEAWSATCDKFDPQDQARVWFSFHGKPNQLNKESIFFWAQEHGWANPMRVAIPESIQQQAKRIVDRLIDTSVPEAETDKPGTPEFKAFPVHGLDEVAAMIGQSSYVNYPDASKSAAVMLACVAASRRYISDTGEGCHIYMGLSAQSISMIRYAINGIQQVLTDAGMRQLFSSTRKSTASIIHEHLIKRPAHLYCVEDFGKMIQQSKRQFGNGSMEHAIDTLCGIYSKTAIQIDYDESATKGKQDSDRVIYSPSLSMLALTSLDQINSLMRASEIGGGLMVNFLHVLCDDDSAITQHDPTPIHCPLWLKQQLSVMRGFKAQSTTKDTVFDFTGDRGDFPAEQIVVPLGTIARHDPTIMALSSKRTLIPMLHGARITMRRIAVALAAWANPVAPVVTDDIADWSADFVMQSMRRYLDEFSIMETGDDGKTSLYQMVLKTIISEGGVNGLTLRELRDRCYRFRQVDSDSRDKVIALLEDDGEIQFVKIGKKKSWVATRFIKKSSQVGEVREPIPAHIPTLEATNGAAFGQSAGVRE